MLTKATHTRLYELPYALASLKLHDQTCRYMGDRVAACFSVVCIRVSEDFPVNSYQYTGDLIAPVQGRLLTKQIMHGATVLSTFWYDRSSSPSQ